MSKKMPKLKTEEEEINFWDKHSFADFVGESKEVKAKFPKPKKQPVPILLDEGRVMALKQLASSKGIGYGTLVKIWIVERLNKEIALLKHT